MYFKYFYLIKIGKMNGLFGISKNISFVAGVIFQALYTPFVYFV